MLLGTYFSLNEMFLPKNIHQVNLEYSGMGIRSSNWDENAPAWLINV